MDQTLKCGQPKAEKACEVPLRYQCQVLRAFSKESVFSQIAFCFELANTDPRVVTLNLVQPEDWLVPVRDFDLHMRMIDYFHQKFPKVQITLHAGELGFGQVPPDVLGYHIPKSIDMGHAQRIGHGTDVMYHPHAQEILHEMALKKVAVEISPSSSKYILGLTGSRHPFRQYLKAGVPVAIATDDEGVSRSDITNEYQQAVEQHGLTYAEVKKISLDSLTYGFLEGQQKAAAMTKLKQVFAEFEKNY
jgi:adenosine deaminase